MATIFIVSRSTIIYLKENVGFISIRIIKGEKPLMNRKMLLLCSYYIPSTVQTCGIIISFLQHNFKRLVWWLSKYIGIEIY